MITKLGEAVAAQPTAWGKFKTGAGKFFNGAGQVAWPFLNVVFPAYQVASGDSSIGQAVGEAAGGQLGYEVGSRLAKNYFTDARIAGYKSPVARMLAKGARGIGAGTLGAIGLGALGSYALDKVMPWKRKPPVGYTNPNAQQGMGMQQ